MHRILRLAEIFYVLAHELCSVMSIWFPPPPHFVLLNIQFGTLLSERIPFLAGIGKHERTHINQNLT